MRISFFLFFFTWYSIVISAQTVDPGFIKMPAITPSSPNVASIEKFGNIPVSHSNGTTSIGVPIWNITCGQISWPLSFAYNTGGIKVDEVSSNVGLGWALMGQGVISRSVLGRPDEDETGEPDYSSVTNTDWYYLYNVLKGISDSEMDMYSYNFNGRSGKFLIKQDGTIFSIPYTTLKITPNANGFIVVDEVGVIYTFDKKETTYVTGQPQYTSSWYLSKIQTGDKKQSIDFTYTDGLIINQSTTSFTQSVGFRPGSACGSSGDEVSIYASTPDYKSTGSGTTVQLISRIDFPNGYIGFSYAKDRTDVSGTGNYRLTTVEVKQANTNTLLKKMALGQGYFATGNRLKLNSITESQSTSGPAKVYGFEYNATAMAPVGSYAQDKWGYNNGKTSNATLLQRDTVVYKGVTYYIGDANRSVDTIAAKAGTLTAINWPTGGRTEITYDVHQYYPGFNVNTTTNINTLATALTPTATSTFTYPSSMVGGARVIVDISQFNYPNTTGNPYVQIKNTTTGAIIFTSTNYSPTMALHNEQSISLVAGNSYEVKSFVLSSVPNTLLTTRIQVLWDVYSNIPAIEKGGGLRVRSVKNFTKPGVLTGTDFYDYEPGLTLSSYHFINLRTADILFRHGVSCQGACVSHLSSNGIVFHSGSIYPATTVAGVPLMYKKVTKYQLDANGLSNGKTVYEYDVIQNNPGELLGNGYFVSFMQNEWRNGFLLKESVFKRTGAATYQLIKLTENAYSEFKLDYVNNLSVKSAMVRTGCMVEDQTTVNNDLYYFPVPVNTGVKKLIRATQTLYDDNGASFQSSARSEYSAASHDFVTKLIRTDSKGAELHTINKYPVDFAVTGNVYAKMITANIVSPVIETKEYRKTSPTDSTWQFTIKNNYRDWKNDGLVLAPEFIQSALKSNPLENKITYTDYNDRKQPTQVRKDQDVPMCYLYGYNFQYPVAQVTNAIQADVAYTSFEAGDKGGWTFSAVPYKDATAPTGEMVVTVNGSISKTGMNTGKTYIISYWKKSGTITISGSTTTTGRTVNGWTYYEHKLTGTIPATITVSGSSAIIDELRLYPGSNVQMSTFTYDPLVGVTSECDANNRILYYEYDELSRLILVRDQDKNIVKKHSYNYDGQTTNDNIYYNVVKTGTFQRNNCGTCSTGSLVTYTVAANTYTSTISQLDADNIAQADVNNNGQAYANSTGTCGAATFASILSTISISQTIQYTFYNRCTGESIVRTKYSNEVDWPLANIPQGNYDVTFNVPSGGYYTFQVVTPAQTYTVATSTLPTTIYNVMFMATGNKVSITP